MTIDVGESSGTVEIPVRPDDFPEPGETLFIAFDSVLSAAPGDTFAIGTIENDDAGLPIPKEVHCHTRYGLDNIADQIFIRSQSMSPIERRRKDIWWVESDGSNAEAVVEDVKRSILEYGVPLLQKPYNARSVQLERRGLAHP